MQTVAAEVRPFQFSPTTAARPRAVPIIHACLPQSSATGRTPCTRVRAVKGSPSSRSRFHQQAVRVLSRNQLAVSLGDVSLYQAQKRSTAAILWISRAESLPPRAVARTELLAERLVDVIGCIDNWQQDSPGYRGPARQSKINPIPAPPEPECPRQTRLYPPSSRAL